MTECREQWLENIRQSFMRYQYRSHHSSQALTNVFLQLWITCINTVAVLMQVQALVCVRERELKGNSETARSCRGVHWWELGFDDYSRSWPRSRKALACHMCVLCPPISSAAFILARPWMGGKERTGAFFDESLNRTKTGGGVKGEKIQCSATLVPPPPQCSLKTLQYYITCMEDWRLLVYILVLKVVTCCLLRYAIT